MNITDNDAAWIRESLTKSGYFQLFAQGESDKFLNGLMKKSYTPGAKIIVEGDTNDFVYLVRSGEVRVEVHRQGKDIPVCVLGEGHLFGEIAVVERGHRIATVAAVTSVEVYLMFREDFRKVLDRNPALKVRLKELMDRRIKETEQVAAANDSFLGALKKRLFKSE